MSKSRLSCFMPPVSLLHDFDTLLNALFSWKMALITCKFDSFTPRWMDGGSSMKLESSFRDFPISQSELESTKSW